MLHDGGRSSESLRRASAERLTWMIRNFDSSSIQKSLSVWIAEGDASQDARDTLDMTMRDVVRREGAKTRSLLVIANSILLSGASSTASMALDAMSASWLRVTKTNARQSVIGHAMAKR